MDSFWQGLSRLDIAIPFNESVLCIFVLSRLSVSVCTNVGHTTVVVAVGTAVTSSEGGCPYRGLDGSELVLMGGVWEY